MAIAISDSSSSIRVSMPRVYKDLPMSFQKHPGTGDVRPIEDLAAVKQSVRNLILTNYGERPFNNNIGSNVASYLFEPVSPFTANAIERDIESVLSEQEPRINGVLVRVYDKSDENAYIVELQYNVVSLNIQVETSFFLRRLR